MQIEEQKDKETAKIAESLLESLNKDHKQEEQQSGTQKEEDKDNDQDAKVTNPELGKATEERQKGHLNNKPIVIVAIDESELNKVELAYFKRPKKNVILSDK